MSFEARTQPNKKEIWLSLVDASLGKHETAVREILQDTGNPEDVVRRLSDYMHENDNVTLIAERDSAEKLGTKMPDFVSTEEEVLWNLFVQLRSDKYS